jgi:hypothetical protein
VTTPLVTTSVAKVTVFAAHETPATLLVSEVEDPAIGTPPVVRPVIASGKRLAVIRPPDVVSTIVLAPVNPTGRLLVRVVAEPAIGTWPVVRPLIPVSVPFVMLIGNPWVASTPV